MSRATWVARPLRRPAANKTNLHGELIMTSYFTVCDGKITSLIIVRTEPAY